MYSVQHSEVVPCLEVGRVQSAGVFSVVSGTIRGQSSNTIKLGAKIKNKDWLVMSCGHARVCNFIRSNKRT